MLYICLLLLGIEVPLPATYGQGSSIAVHLKSDYSGVTLGRMTADSMREAICMSGKTKGGMVV